MLRVSASCTARLTFAMEVKALTRQRFVLLGIDCCSCSYSSGQGLDGAGRLPKDFLVCYFGNGAGKILRCLVHPALSRVFAPRTMDGIFVLSGEVDGGSDFGKGGDAGEDLQEPVLRHREVALLARQFRYFVFGWVVAEEVCELVVHEYRFIQTDAAFIASLLFVCRFRFPYRFHIFRHQGFVRERLKYFHYHLLLFVRKFSFFLRIRIELTQEALRHRDRDGRTEGLRVRAEVCEARVGAGRVVGVERGEDD